MPVEPAPLVAPAAAQENSTPASQCPVRPWCRCDGAVGAVEAVEGRFGRFAWGRGVVGRCCRVELLTARNIVGSGGALLRLTLAGPWAGLALHRKHRCVAFLGWGWRCKGGLHLLICEWK